VRLRQHDIIIRLPRATAAAITEIAGRQEMLPNVWIELALAEAVRCADMEWEKPNGNNN